ncbi:hypothetical protein Tco_0115111 [Tanacetum coccineum]
MHDEDPKDLKTKSFANVQELFDKAMKREPSKKQEVDDDKETEELKKCMEIISNDGDDVTIKAIPLSTKSPNQFMTTRSTKEVKKSYFPNYQSICLDYKCEMAFELLRLVKKQLKEGYGRIVGIKSLLEVTAITVLVTAAKHKLVMMDDPNITMEEYIRLEEEKARKSGKVFNWETANDGKICSLNDEINFRISFDDSDDEDYTVVFDKNSFSYKIISTNDLKTDSENDNEKVMPSLPSPEPAVSCFDDLDFFKDFENEFPVIVYNDTQTSK